MKNDPFFEGKKTEKNDRIDLPFGPKKSDWGEWVYDHRIGLCTTVLVYLLLGFLFISTRIIIGRERTVQGFFIDLEQLLDEKEQLEEEIREKERQETFDERYFEELRNVASNEDGQLNPDLRDDRGTAASELYESARELEGRLNETRRMYEQGVEAAENILNEGRRSDNGVENSPQTAKVQGRVTVSYYLPGRNDVYLHMPAYQCEGGGEITINITVDRNGRVTGTSIAGGSSADGCLRDMAIRAAQASRFNTDGTAENRQQGTITYIFVPQ